MEPATHLPSLQRFYESQNYFATISPDALLVSARLGGRLVGLVRIEPEEGLQVLRGMNVEPVCQRQGIGRRMLVFLAPLLDRDCYCLPYGWLENFYGSIGFVRQSGGVAQPHLARRLADYRGRGEPTILMFRPAAPTG